MPVGQKYTGETGMGKSLRVKRVWVGRLWAKNVLVKVPG